MSHSLPGLVLELASPYCAAEDMGDEIVALNVDTGIYFSMRDLGAALWRDLAAGHPVDDLAARVEKATGSEEAVRTFVDKILHHGLMSERTPLPVSAEPTIAARLANGEREIVVEVFEDMKDLILSDPIHDVDETVGWPKQLVPTS